MTVNDLTADQLKPVAEYAERRRDYLQRMHDRMKALGFPTDDPLLAAIRHEWEAAGNTMVVASSALSRRPVMERKPWAG